MKKSLIYTLLATLVLFACRKSDNSILPDLKRAPVVLVNLDATSDKFISPVNPAGFKGVVTVDLLFANEVPQKVDLVVMKNGNSGDVRVLKADITTFPTKVEFTGQQLINLFGGAAIAGGTSFEVGANVTNKDGELLLAFPPGASAYSASNVSTIGNVKPGATTSVQYLMPCPFNADAYVGNFEVLQDDWADYKKGDVIQVKKVSATELSFEYAVDPGSSKPIILTINPSDNSISVAKQVYGSYGGDVFTAEGVAGASSAVNPCDVSLSVRLKHSTVGFSGSYTIRLKKK